MPVNAKSAPVTDQILVHLNVVRPLGAFRSNMPEAVYFFTEVPRVFAAAKVFGGLVWHNHAARMPDGRFLLLPEPMAVKTESTSENFHIMTMAGWKDAAALHRFSHRDRLHVDGMKNLRD